MSPGGERRAAALDRRGDRGAVRAAVQRSAAIARSRCIARISIQRGAAVDAAVDQDRRLPGGLRLLPAGGALPHRRRRTRRCCRVDEVVAAARAAKANGATRFCMGAAWRGPKERDLEPVLDDGARRCEALGLETCATLGMLKDGQAEQLKEAGLDYYNHNLDTAPEFYGEIITTRDYQRSPRHARARARRRHPRLLRRHRRHGRDRARSARGADRAAREPRSVSGVGADQPPRAGRGHAAARHRERARSVRVRAHDRRARASRCRRRWCGSRPAGSEMGEAVQALCFLAGANSIFYGEKLLTTGNPGRRADRALFAKLGLAADATRTRREPRWRADDERCIAALERGARRRARPRACARAARRSSRRRARASPSTGASYVAFAQQRLPRARRASRARRGRARRRARAGASAPARRTSSAGTSRRTQRSKRELAAFVAPCAARARCCSRPATWPISASSPRSPGAATRCSPTG